ncbi:MAG: class I tRNA ligase family protein, partial [Alphaproteobacteria bacterium]|nr:class I tRNA ligase family protein [Alphaproteobacteria bacterium]
MKHYANVSAKPDFVKLEKEILNFWEENSTFEKSVKNRDGAAEFVFYDGPPFANGTPHYGHIMVSYVKDVVARFQTMIGKKVERRLGWDCHGLPAEMSAEKQLGVSGRKQIEEYGVEKFNDFCRADVLKYSGIWVEENARNEKIDLTSTPLYDDSNPECNLHLMTNMECGAIMYLMHSFENPEEIILEKDEYVA